MSKLSPVALSPTKLSPLTRFIKSNQKDPLPSLRLTVTPEPDLSDTEVTDELGKRGFSKLREYNTSIGRLIFCLDGTGSQLFVLTRKTRGTLLEECEISNIPTAIKNSYRRHLTYDCKGFVLENDGEIHIIYRSKGELTDKTYAKSQERHRSQYPMAYPLVDIYELEADYFESHHANSKRIISELQHSTLVQIMRETNGIVQKLADDFDEVCNLEGLDKLYAQNVNYHDFVHLLGSINEIRDQINMSYTMLSKIKNHMNK